MIDKKIKYAIQGKVKNYLGKQKMVKAPKYWKSGPDHPDTELAYITKAEKDLTSTSATTLYTVPSATTAVIKSILVSEDSGNADTITVTITDTSDAVFSLFKTKAISANATTELLSAPLVAAESEVIKVTAATANRLHVVLSALEIKPRVVTT